MITKKIWIFTFAILFLISGSMFVSAITGSIGNGKMVLYPEVNGWTNTIIEKTILVNNVNDVPINVTLKVDSNSSKFIDLIDESFILEAGESKKAEIIIKVKKEGTYEGRVNVFFTPVEGSDGGVVLSSTIVVIAKKDTGYEEEEEEETTEEEQTDLENEEQEGTDSPSKLIKIWGFSTLILLVVLLILLYIWGKKRNKRKSKTRKK